MQAEEEEPLIKAPGVADEALRQLDTPHSEQRTLLEELRRDVDSVRLLVDEQVAPQEQLDSSQMESSSQLRPRRNSAQLVEHVGALETINERHVDSLLPRMKAIDGEMRAVQERVAALKADQEIHVFSRLRKISEYQVPVWPRTAHPLPPPRRPPPPLPCAPRHRCCCCSAATSP